MDVLNGIISSFQALPTVGPDDVLVLKNADETVALLRGLWAPQRCMKEAIADEDAERVVFLLVHAYHLPEASALACSAILQWAQASRM